MRNINLVLFSRYESRNSVGGGGFRGGAKGVADSPYMWFACRWLGNGDLMKPTPLCALL